MFLHLSLSEILLGGGDLHPEGVGLHAGRVGRPPPPRDTVNERAVRILLECILVFFIFIRVEYNLYL